MNIPSKVKIGSRIYSIKKNYKFEEETGLWGQTIHSDLEIRLSPTSRGIMEETLMHEIFHAIDSVYNNSALTEETVTRLSHGVAQVLKDNKLF